MLIKTGEAEWDVPGCAGWRSCLMSGFPPLYAQSLAERLAAARIGSTRPPVRAPGR